jgi:hypothetical protein
MFRSWRLANTGCIEGNALSSLGCVKYSSAYSLVLPFEGANNSTVFTDYSSYGHTVGTNGLPVISTAQCAAGTSSLYLNGSSSLTIPYHASIDFGTGDFRIDFWARYASASGVQCFIATAVDGSPTNYLDVYYDGSNQLLRFRNLNSEVSIAHTPSTNTWYHYAFFRYSGVGYISIDNSVVASASFSAVASVNTALNIGKGRNGQTNYFNGYVDDFRILKGVYAA